MISEHLVVDFLVARKQLVRRLAIWNTSIAIGDEETLAFGGGVCIDDTPLHFEKIPRRSGQIREIILVFRGQDSIQISSLCLAKSSFWLSSGHPVNGFLGEGSLPETLTRS